MNSNKAIKTVAIIAILFGAATILSGGKALFGGVEARAAVGQAVPFVLWFNFLAGFLYLVAGAGLFLSKPWSVPVSIVLLASTLAVFAAFGFHVAGGGAYEARTVAAMGIRTIFWAMASVVAWRALGGMTGTRGKGGLRGSALTSLVIAASVLMACNKRNHEKESPAARESGRPGAEAPAGEKGGVKWQADATTNGGIVKMQAMVKAFDPGAGVEGLQEPLSKEFNRILEQCTMQGEAHDHLHHYLIPLKARIDALDNENGAGTLQELSAYLSTYWDHFRQ